MKYLKPALIALIALFASFIYFIIASPTIIDRDQTVELVSVRGSCSGSYVKAPSGKTYIISAGHCAVLADLMGYMPILHEDGSLSHVRVLKVDIPNDLMLLESDNIDAIGIKVADGLRSGDKIYAYTHPLGNKLHLAVGVFNWYKMVNTESFTNLEGETYLPGTTFGSSGSPVLNYSGNLVGIISAGDTETGENFFVSLDDIQTFLAAF